MIPGRGRLEAAGVLDLRPNSICLVPPGLPHREASEEILDTLWIGLKGSRLARLDIRTVPNVRDEPLARQIEHLWMFAQKTMELIGPELDAAAAGVLARFLRLAASGCAEGPSDHIDRAIRIMMERIAEQAGFSSLYYFSRLFRRHNGMCPTRYRETAS